MHTHCSPLAASTEGPLRYCPSTFFLPGIAPTSSSCVLAEIYIKTRLDGCSKAAILLFPSAYQAPLHPASNQKHIDRKSSLFQGFLYCKNSFHRLSIFHLQTSITESLRYTAFRRTPFSLSSSIFLHTQKTHHIHNVFLYTKHAARFPRRQLLSRFSCCCPQQRRPLLLCHSRRPRV